MKQFILIFTLICFTMIGWFTEIQAQTDLEKVAENEYVLSVGGEGVTLDDFKHIYGKNNRDSVITRELLDDYMELFVKFKLKVMEAEYLGMDTVADYIKELAGYRKQLARPYLVDIDLLDELVQEAFDRQQATFL
jgi:peptidyl-prolyl cis-trans isomerase SurA